MLTSSLLKVLHAAHYSHLVQGEWSERGGIMLVAPPGTLKTTMVSSLDVHADTLLLSDINVVTITRLRDDVACGRYRTLVFPEYEKLYQRHPNTALNIEGHIKAFVEEGFKSASFEDSRAPGQPAQALVIGCLTPACVRKYWERWCSSGFARRFIWVTYGFDTSVIIDAIHNWKKKNLGDIILKVTSGKRIPYTLTEKESLRIRQMIKYQRGQETPFVLMKRIACVLKQIDAATKESTCWEIIKDFSQAMTEKGSKLEIEEEVK